MNKYEEALQEILQLSNFIVNAKSVPDIYMYQGQGVRISLCAQKLLEIVNRATPMKPARDDWGSNVCPNCKGYRLWCSFENYGYCDTRLDHCPECGQALDWSEEK